MVDADPLASLYQTSGWCLPWYRCYHEAFDPYVIVVSAGERVVGLVPMAVDRQTNELVFAAYLRERSLDRKTTELVFVLSLTVLRGERKPSPGILADE